MGETEYNIFKFLFFQRVTDYDPVQDFVSCIKSIPMPEAIAINIQSFKRILKKVLHNNVDVDELTRMLDDVLSIEVIKSEIGYEFFKNYTSFLARAILDCKKYASRYEKCKALEETGAPPDEIEICYEVAGKSRKPIFIYFPW